MNLSIHPNVDVRDAYARLKSRGFSGLVGTPMECRRYLEEIRAIDAREDEASDETMAIEIQEAEDLLLISNCLESEGEEPRLCRI